MGSGLRCLAVGDILHQHFAVDFVHAAELFDAVDYKKYTYERDFEKAVRAAADVAENGDVVLLSPAAASFDSFRNFEKRGDFFCYIVRNL